jgi:hypothetical protein
MIFIFSVQRRFCSNLGMTNQAVKAAHEAVQKSEELDIRLVPVFFYLGQQCRSVIIAWSASGICLCVHMYCTVC